MILNNFIYKVVIAFLVIAVSIKTTSAQDQWLMHVPTISQSLINPAYQLNKKLEISLPSVGYDFNSSGIDIGNAITKNMSGINELSLEKLALNLKDNHPFNGQVIFNTLDFGYKIKSINLFAGHALINKNSFSLDKDIVNLYLNGNAPYIGKKLDLDIQGSSTTYHQFYIGGSTKIGKLTIGTKIKYLNGWYNLSSETSKIGFTTEDDYYQIKLENDVEIKSTGVLLYNGEIKDLDLYTNFTSYPKFITSNSGIGFDLGLTYDVNDKLVLMLNAVDVGSITWRDNAKIFTNKKTSLLKGIDIETIIDGGSGDDISDSLYNAFELTEIDSEYSTAVSASFNAGAIYKSRKYTFSGIFSTQSLIDQSKFVMSLQASKKIGKHFDLGINYSLKNDSYNNFGIMAFGHFGPLNIFAATQNIISAFNTKEINGFNGRIGITFGFGKVEKLSEEEIQK
jgi:hypothetical protein